MIASFAKSQGVDASRRGHPWTRFRTMSRAMARTSQIPRIPFPSELRISRLFGRLIALSLFSVVLAIVLDLAVRHVLPLPYWVYMVILCGVTVPLMVVGGLLFFRRVVRQEWALRRRDVRNWVQARRDPLTCAENRKALTEVISVLNREKPGTLAALYVLDLHEFQRINDTCGYDVGDAVLREVSRRLRATLSRHFPSLSFRSTYACQPYEPRIIRVGSDELGFWQPNMVNEAAVGAVAEDILSVLDAPFRVGRFKLYVRGSVGYVIERIGELSASDWLTRANAASQQARSFGAGRSVVFAVPHIDALVRRHGLQQALHDSLEEGRGFTLEYQPIVSIDQHGLIGCEALVRWVHPEWGQVSPAEFIPVSEGSDLIRPLGRWVLAEAMRQWAAWQGAAPSSALAALKMSVNLSRAQLHDVQLVSFVEELLQRHQVPPHALRLEVTESLPIDDPDSLSTLERLRDLGVSLALDDFGTGYSSLSALLNLPIRSVKIDRQFVSGIDQCPYRQALVSGVVKVAQLKGLDVVAEGIEHDVESRKLQELGCQYIQGWHVSRSLNPEAFLQRWLQPLVHTRTATAHQDAVGVAQTLDSTLPGFSRFASAPLQAKASPVSEAVVMQLPVPRRRHPENSSRISAHPFPTVKQA